MEMGNPYQRCPICNQLLERVLGDKETDWACASKIHFWTTPYLKTLEPKALKEPHHADVWSLDGG